MKVTADEAMSAVASTAVSAPRLYTAYLVVYMPWYFEGALNGGRGRLYCPWVRRREFS